MDISKSLKKKQWLIPLVFSLLASSILVTFFSHFTSTPFHQTRDMKPQVPIFVESKLHVSPTLSISSVPRLAYLISGSSGDGESLKRTLKAFYHPLNEYVVHLDLEAPADERLELISFVESEELFVRVGNVRMIRRSNLVTCRGPSMVSNTLHAAAILFKEAGEWDWFINLSASDYPLLTQDDMLHTLSAIPRSLNFIEHTSDIGWKEYVVPPPLGQTNLSALNITASQPVIIDPALYSLQKSDVFWVSETRRMSTAFKLFTGSAWMMLSRPFIEFCLMGWDNLPRMVLMYYANFLSSPEGYFHTVICNSEQFRNTTVNHDLHFISWDNPPKQHPHFHTVDDYQKMVESNVPFARKFGSLEQAVLDKIDSDILGRSVDGFVPGGWFDGNGRISHYNLENVTTLRPGPGAERFKHLISSLMSDNNLHAKHCV